MGEKNVFRFLYSHLELKKWKEIVQKVLDVDSKAGFKFQSFRIRPYYRPNYCIEGEWKNENHLFRVLENEVERTFRAKKWLFFNIYGDFLGYFTEFTFLIDAEEKDVGFFVESIDPKWVKASKRDKLKLNKLLKDFSDVLGVGIEEWEVEPPYNTKIKVSRYGFALGRKGRGKTSRRR
jgi:hypothetical protein